MNMQLNYMRRKRMSNPNDSRFCRVCEQIVSRDGDSVLVALNLRTKILVHVGCAEAIRAALENKENRIEKKE